MSRRFIGWLGATLIGVTIVAVALVAVLRTQPVADSDSPSASVDPSLALKDPDPTETYELGEESDAENLEVDSEFRDLSYHCPSIEGELTDDCLLALENKFGQELTQPGPLVPVCDQPTWSQVFQDPVGKREQVVEALSREECRSENDEIRRNPDCARHAIAELGVLHHQCISENEYRNGAEFTAGTLSERLDNIESEDINEYRQERRRIQSEYYRERWIAARCGLVGDGVLAPIDELDGIYVGHWSMWFPLYTPESEVVADEAVKGPIWKHKEDLRIRNQGNTLLAAAARLGHLWALSGYSQNHLFLDDLFTLNPSQALINRGHWHASHLHDGAVYDEFDWDAMFEKAEKLSPGLMERFESADIGDFFSSDFEKNMQDWWDSQEPAVSELYADFRRRGTELLETRQRERDSVRRTHIHAALLHMQRQSIQYSEDAIPDWAVDVTEEELAKAEETIEWLDAEHPHARQAANPGEREACESGVVESSSSPSSSESDVDETEFERASE